MMIRSSALVAVGLAFALTAGAAFAQTAAPAAPAAPAAAAPKAAAPAMDKKAMSKDCSAKADQQGLHGKARKAFRSKCKAGKM